MAALAVSPNQSVKTLRLGGFRESGIGPHRSSIFDRPRPKRPPRNRELSGSGLVMFADFARTRRGRDRLLSLLCAHFRLQERLADLIIRRFEAETGEKAIRGRPGRTQEALGNSLAPYWSLAQPYLSAIATSPRPRSSRIRPPPGTPFSFVTRMRERSALPAADERKRARSNH